MLDIHPTGFPECFRCNFNKNVRIAGCFHAPEALKRFPLHGPCSVVRFGQTPKKRKGSILDRKTTSLFPKEELAVYDLIARNDGMKAREIAATLGLEKTAVSRLLFSAPLMREMCYQDAEYRWHALIRRGRQHGGLYEFSGWYGTVREFLETPEETWLEQLQEGCRRIGRNLNDTRGLLHSFRDCGETMRGLFRDLEEMTDRDHGEWELVFEFRLNRSRMIRIYADVLLITRERVFSFEFKMKNAVDPDEVIQAAKYCPYLEIVFGSGYDIIPALVLTAASDLFRFIPISGTDAELPVCSGDMLFNVLNEYMRFLA